MAESNADFYYRATGDGWVVYISREFSGKEGEMDIVGSTGYFDGVMERTDFWCMYIYIYIYMSCWFLGSMATTEKYS